MAGSITTCDEVLAILEKAVSFLTKNTNIEANAIITANAHIAAGHAALRDAVQRLETVRLSTNIKTMSSDLSCNKQIVTTGDGSGAGSPEVFREITIRNWHGRLGRTHMVDVDHMLDSSKKELDCYLRRTINALFPVRGMYKKVDYDTVFATLSAFGLRLEDKGPMADVTIFSDSLNQEATTMARLQNLGAYYLTNTGTFENYWKSSALETLIELARYRGLFGVDGFLKVVN
ncbi:hypothetical protein Q9L58_009027 [Maublancomyces gigas]|uniref:Uncharacterized protein n=1 Tax=Discina gigas TaxID=1032678 RepID=A0ABR3G8K0_9PEZI